MSACFALGLDAGAPIKAAGGRTGASIRSLPGCPSSCSSPPADSSPTPPTASTRTCATTPPGPVNRSTLANNLLFCALAGLLWYSQFFGLETGKSFHRSPILRPSVEHPSCR